MRLGCAPMIMAFGFRSFLRRRCRYVGLVLAAAMCLFLSAVVSAQPPAGGATQASARGATGSAAPRVESNLLQLMRGILYPSSNVIFAAQDDLSKFTPAADPATSPNPLTSTYGGWQAVENAALALAE